MLAPRDRVLENRLEEVEDPKPVMCEKGAGVEVGKSRSSQGASVGGSEAGARSAPQHQQSQALPLWAQTASRPHLPIYRRGLPATRGPCRDIGQAGGWQGC